MSDALFLTLFYIALIVPQFILAMHLCTKNPKTPISNALNTTALFIFFSMISFFMYATSFNKCIIFDTFNCYDSDMINAHMALLLILYGFGMALVFPLFIRYFIYKVFTKAVSNTVSEIKNLGNKHDS